MKKLFGLFALLSLAVGFTACEKGVNNNETPNTTVTISVDKNEIMADGKEFATFTVNVAEAQIICLNDNSVSQALHSRLPQRASIVLLLFTMA